MPVRPPTRIAGFIYRRAGVHILTRDSVARPTIRTVVVVSAVVGFISRLKPWAFSLNRCNFPALGGFTPDSDVSFLESRLVELVQIVEDDDVVAIADESFREVTADESRTPP